MRGEVVVSDAAVMDAACAAVFAPSAKLDDLL